MINTLCMEVGVLYPWGLSLVNHPFTPLDINVVNRIIMVYYTFGYRA